MLNFTYYKVLTKFCIVILFLNEMLWNGVASCRCGIKPIISPRIARGDIAADHEFPWQVAIYNFRRFICGGSLINNLYVLTAAHCFNDFRDRRTFNPVPYDIRVALGVHQRTEFDKFKEGRREIKEVIIHEKYVCAEKHHDIALMKMKRPMTIVSPEINPICLPPIRTYFDGRIATVSGWGIENEYGKVVNILRKANIKILTNYQCNVKLGTVFDQSIMLCTDSVVSQACPGDSGGPLMAHTGHQYLLAGIVSFGYGCRATFIPDVFTRVSAFIQWIQNHTRDANYCKE